VLACSFLGHVYELKVTALVAKTCLIVLLYFYEDSGDGEIKKNQEGFRDIFTERAVSLWGDRSLLRLFLAPYNPLSNRACMCMRQSEHVFAKSSSRLSP